MGRYTGPQCRLCRTEKRALYLKGDRCRGPKCAIAKKRSEPGKGPKRRMKKMSDYGIQLREKQKLKRIYGMMEKQFKITFSDAVRMKGITGDNLVALLEQRLDNVVFRMHFAGSRKQARQLVSHGHIKVNGQRVTVPSFRLKESDKVEIFDKSKKMTVIKESLKEFSRIGVVPWLEVNPDEICGTFKSVPRRNDITDLVDVKEQLIVELYSK